MTQSIFNYQTITTTLRKSTRTLFIKLDNDHRDNAITMETLFELESLLSWVTTHVEIHTVFIHSSTDLFSSGYNKKILGKLTIDKLANFTNKLQKINQAIMLLPQTVIIDLQMGAHNIASELATACDMRLAHRSCTINFNHTKMGIIPCSGGVAQLSQVVGHGVAKNWLLSARDIKFHKLENAGFIFDSYNNENRDEVIDQLLADIHEQSPVQRIQTKLAVIENVREQIEEQLTIEKKVAKAAMITEDWKDINNDDSMKTQSMKTAVKLSIVKSDPEV